MKSTLVKFAVTATLLSAGTPAFADLIYVTGTQTPGTGLGTVSTLVTVQDNGAGNGNGNGNGDNGIQSGCVTYNAGNPNNPGETCPMSTGLEGGDNTSAAGGNNTYFLNTIAGLTSAGQLGLVVNISEGAPGNSAVLTNLYLSLFNTSNNQTRFYSYTGVDLTLFGNGGIGQSGNHRFILDGLQAADAASFCQNLAQCVVGGGVQFGLNSTESTPETVYVGAFQRDGTGTPGGQPIPEPGSLALLGMGALAFGTLRRRTVAKH